MISTVVAGQEEREPQRERSGGWLGTRKSWRRWRCRTFGEGPRRLARLRPRADALVVDRSYFERVVMTLTKVSEEVRTLVAAAGYLDEKQASLAFGEAGKAGTR